MKPSDFDCKQEDSLICRESDAMRVLDAKDGDAALLLIYTMSLRGKPFTDEDASAALEMSAQRIAAAKKKLEARDRADNAKVNLGAQPEYTAREISGFIEADPDFAFLYRHAESCFGRPLRQHEVSSLLAVYDDLGLPAGVAALLITRLAADAARQSEGGESKPLSFRKINREAVRWHELGITTEEEAEQYLTKVDEKRSHISKARRILGIAGHKASQSEIKNLEAIVSLDPDGELLPKAYDITVMKKGALVWPYMMSILRNWNKSGFKTARDVEEGQKSSPRRVNTASAGQDEYEARVREYIRRKSEGDAR